VEVGDVATLLPEENVKQVDVCESDVLYETNKEQEHEEIEVKCEAVVGGTEIAYEIEDECEEMPQAPGAQDVLVPPSDNLSSVCANICKDLDELMDKLESKPVDESKSVKQYEAVRIRFNDGFSDTSGSGVIAELGECNEEKKKQLVVRYDEKELTAVKSADAGVRKSSRRGKKRMEPDDPSDALEIIGQRATTLHDFGSDFLVKKHDKPDSWWVHEDELRDSGHGCAAMEVFDNKRCAAMEVFDNKRRRK
jgi:hypothetical protein